MISDSVQASEEPQEADEQEEEEEEYEDIPQFDREQLIESYHVCVCDLYTIATKLLCSVRHSQIFLVLA